MYRAADTLPTGAEVEDKQIDVNSRILEILNRLIIKDCELMREDAVLVFSLRDDVRASLAEYTVDEELRKTLTTTSARKFTPTDIVDSVVDAIEQIDPGLSTHHKNVQQLAFAIGSIIESEDRDLLPEGAFQSALAASVHDVGKLDPEIAGLISPDRELSFAEKQPIAQHSNMGSLVLNYLDLPEDITAVADLHHVTYPHSPRHDRYSISELPMAVRLTTVVDAIDAMIAERPGNGIQSIGYVINELENGVSEEIFDPRAVSAFLKICNSLGYKRSSDETVTVQEILETYSIGSIKEVACA